MMTSEPKAPLTLDGSTLRVIPTPRRIDLATLEQVRSEMARVYRESRSGKLDSQEASRFTYILSQIGKMIELAVLERRIERLEGLQDGNVPRIEN